MEEDLHFFWNFLEIFSNFYKKNWSRNGLSSGGRDFWGGWGGRGAWGGLGGRDGRVFWFGWGVWGGWVGWFGEKVEQVVGKSITTSFNET